MRDCAVVGDVVPTTILTRIPRKPHVNPLLHLILLRLLSVLAVLTVATAGGRAVAATGPVSFEGSNRQPFAHSIELLRDPQAVMTIDDARSADQAARFQALDLAGERRGFLDGATWVRFSIHNPASTSRERWFEVGYPFQQSYRVFVVAGDGSVERMESGTMVSAERRPLASRRVLFPLRLEPGERKTVFLRVAGRGATVLDLTLWEPGALLDYQTLRSTLKYLALGASLLVVVFSILAWRARRRPALLAVGVAHLFGISIAMMLDGLHFSLLPADAAHWMGRLPNMALFLGLGCHAMFAREFLHLQRHSRALSRVMLGVAAACAAIGVLPLMVVAAPWFAGATLVVSLALTIAAAMALQWEREAAARYLAAWGLFWIALVMRTMQLLGWMPGEEFVGDMPFAVLVVSTAVLAYALHVDVRSVRDRGEAAQQRLFEMQQDEQTRLMRAVESRTAELREAKARAEQASEAKSAFLSTMSHELRTPLHTILGYVQLLRRSRRHGDGGKLEVVERAGTHLLRLIDEVLEYSRTETRRPVLDKRPVRLAELTAHLVDSAKLMAAENGNRFRADLGNGLPEVVLADEQRVAQVVLNLIRNACAHTEKGTVRLRIARAGDAPRPPFADGEMAHWHDVLFEVIDDGCGIDPDELPHVFEPFHRAGAGSAKPGLGLGLSISRQLVQGMGSDIGVESRRGLGSRFHFTLRLRALQAGGQQVVRPVSARIIGHQGRRRHLLIVDDMADNRAFLRDLCGSWGFAVAESHDVASVLDACCQPDLPYDAVIVDQFMPVMDGWTFLRLLRERAGAALPVILLSAAAPQPPRDFPAGLRFDHVLIKPLRFDEFAQALRDLLELEWIEETADALPVADAAE